MDINEINNVIKNASVLIDTQTIQACIDKLAAKLTDEYQRKNPVCLVAMKGGVVFAGQLLTRLDFLLQVEYCHPTRYGMHTTGADMQWKTKPPESVSGRDVLILDDIYDEGHTLLSIAQECQQLGAKTVNVAVLISKKHNRKIPLPVNNIHCGFEVPDKFIFGFGLDYKGYFRNCNCVYALEKPHN
jgi:hypoxanthine phosphoribosyltransferase